MKKEVGKVTPQERDEIKRLFERRMGLVELAKIVNASDTELYDRLVTDLSDNSTKFQQWWDNMSEKYDWESSDEGNWEIDFQTCIIYLNVPE